MVAWYFTVFCALVAHARNPKANATETILNRMSDSRKSGDCSWFGRGVLEKSTTEARRHGGNQSQGSFVCVRRRASILAADSPKVELPSSVSLCLRGGFVASTPADPDEDAGCPASERILQRKLDQPRCTDGRGDRSGTRAGRRTYRCKCRVRERRMVEQVEEVRQETQALPFRQLKDFTQAEVDILLRRSDDAVPRRVAEQGCIAIPARRKLGERVRLICHRVDPAR